MFGTNLRGIVLSNRPHHAAKCDINLALTEQQADSQWEKHLDCLEQARPMLAEKGWLIETIAEVATQDTTTRASEQ